MVENLQKDTAAGEIIGKADNERMIMIKCRYISRGFIDPRRGDTVTIHFEVQRQGINFGEDDNNIFRQYMKIKPAFDKKLKDLLYLENKFNGRESWFEVDGIKTRIGRFSGHGPAPDYPCPIEPCIDINFNIGEVLI